MIIKTIDQFSEDKFKEKGSLFIGQIYPVSTFAECDEILSSIRKKYYDATHHCYAINILDEEPKYSDDGEPSGTAGIRIKNAINHFELVNVMVVVIRYFGGTKLGVGPLGKAYYNSAEAAIKSSKIVEKEKYIKTDIEYDYQHSKTVHHFLNKYGAKKIENLFKNRPVIRCYVKPENSHFLKESLLSASQNTINCRFFEDKTLFLAIQT